MLSLITVSSSQQVYQRCVQLYSKFMLDYVKVGIPTRKQKS